MKKTLVAVAAMAAVTGAMAQAAITGNIDQALVNTKYGDAAKVSAFQGSGFGNGTLADSFLTFSGAEDLGGGLKASFKIEPRLDLNAAAHTMTNREAYLGLAGGFGDIKIGANYTPIFLMVAAGSDVGGVSNAMGWLPATAGTITIGGGTSNILYTLPSFATGLNVQYMLKKGGADSVGNDVPTTYTYTANGAVDTVTGGRGRGDGTGLAASYNVGALTAGFGTETTKNTRMGFVDNLSNYQVVAEASATQSKKNTAMSLAYNAGFANLTYLNAKAALGTGTIKTNTYAISVPLGATTINYSMSTQSSNTGVAAAVLSVFSSATVTLRVSDLPLRQTSRVEVVPGLVSPTKRGKSDQRPIGLSPNLVITSPGKTPALSAGASGSTPPTKAPSALGKPMACATSLLTSPICTPILLRVTDPVARN
jgi:predicted porin